MNGEPQDPKQVRAKLVAQLRARANDVYDEIELSQVGATDFHILRAIMGLMDCINIIAKGLEQ